MAKRRPRDLLLAAGFIVGTIGFGGATTARAQGTIPGLTSTPITFSGHADAFVAGPDGNVWLVDSNANAIGRLAVDGSAYQTFAVPTLSAGLQSITVGPDGNLWFTETSAAQVGRITTSGSVTEFPIPGSFHFVFPVLVATGSIASGPDGNLWISGSNQMAKVTPQGAVTVMTLPLPQGIFTLSIGKCVAGSDNNLWCESADNTTAHHTAKLTTSGIVTLYPGQGQSFDFVNGPDGNVWYVSQQQPFIPPFTLTRITPAGVETVYALPTQRDAEGLAVGADGNLWFTERTTMGNLWQLVLSTATGDGHATFNSAPITTSYPEGIIAVTSPAGVSGIHTNQASATSCPPGIQFVILTSTNYGANVTRVYTSSPKECTHIYARAELSRFSEEPSSRRAELICAVSSGVPNAAAKPKLVLVAPPHSEISVLEDKDWTDCGVNDTLDRVECNATEIGQGHSLAATVVFAVVEGTFTLTCYSNTPQIPPAPDPPPEGFDFVVTIGKSVIQPETVDVSERSKQ